MKQIEILGSLICLAMAAFAADMTHEETVVRTAYAKLSYASEQRVVIQLGVESLGETVGAQPSRLTAEQRLQSAHVSFTLNDFVIGNVADIINRNVSDFITPAGPEVLLGSENTVNFDEGGSMIQSKGIELRWQPQSAPTPPEAGTALKLSDLYQTQWHLDRPAAAWQRYASYSVAVAYQGKTRGPYKALFIFGHDANGNEVIEPADSTVPSGLASAMAERWFPSILTGTSIRNSPVVATWLSTRGIQSPSCSTGLGDVCCDLELMQCGPGYKDLAVALAEPLPTSNNH